MAIISPQTAPNFAIGEYHRILRAELLCAPGQQEPCWNILVGFYANEYARNQNTQPMWVNNVVIPLKDLPVDPRTELYNLLMQNELFAGKNAAPDV